MSLLQMLVRIISSANSPSAGLTYYMGKSDSEDLSGAVFVLGLRFENF